MNDLLCYIKETDRGLWPVPEKESAQALSRWAGGQKAGTAIIMRVLKKLNARRDVHHALYRLRNAILAPALDTDVDSLHDWIKAELDMIEENEIAGKTHKRLRSQKEFTSEEMNAMFAKQDELRDFVNLDREPEHYLILPEGENANEKREPA